jgi:hypothetical protein
LQCAIYHFFENVSRTLSCGFAKYINKPDHF